MAKRGRPRKQPELPSQVIERERAVTPEPPSEAPKVAALPPPPMGVVQPEQAPILTACALVGARLADVKEWELTSHDARLVVIPGTVYRFAREQLGI